MTQAGRRRWRPAWVTLATLAVVLVSAAGPSAVATAAEDLPPLDRPAIEQAVEQAYTEVDAALPLKDRLLRFAGDLIVRAFAFAFGRGDGLSLLFGLVALVLLGGLTWWLYRRLGLVGAAPAPNPASPGGGPAAVDWQRRAAWARSQGDLEGAVRAGWQHLLHVLDDRGVVREAPSLTASETATATRAADPELGRTVDAAADAFERVVFADEVATEAHDRAVRVAGERAEGS